MGRLRFNKNAESLLNSNKDYYINTDNIEPVILNNIFNNNHPIEIEIGMGKGDFILSHALKNPDINFIGIEKYKTVLLKALNKFKKISYLLTNLKITSLDANKIDFYFQKNSVSKIYLNFSDPWPKKAHEKRRLLHDNFLIKYQKILKESGLILFKTDNDGLFEWFVNEVLERNKTKIHVEYLTWDLYKDTNSIWFQNNIQTEYEKKFLLENKSIKSVVFKFIS